MVELARDTEAFKCQHHARAEIVERVVRGRREVALLLAHGVAEPRLAGVPPALTPIHPPVPPAGTPPARAPAAPHALPPRPPQPPAGPPPPAHALPHPL